MSENIEINSELEYHIFLLLLNENLNPPPNLVCPNPEVDVSLT